MNVSQLLYSGGVLAKEGLYDNYKEHMVSEAVKGYNAGMSALPLIGTTALATSMISKFQEGALYSFGAEPVVGDKGYGFVKGKLIKDAAGKVTGTNLGGIISGSHGFFMPGQGAFSAVTAGNKATMESGVKSLSAAKMGVGIMSQNALSTILPAGMTLYFAADAYAQDGMTGLGKYMVADFLGNYYGTQAAVQTLQVAGEGRANLFFKGGGEPLKKGELLQRIAKVGNSGLIGRMLPTLGGIMGATMGMEVGATLGSAATSLIGSGGPSDTSGAILGGLLGTIGGAKLGAYAFSSIPTAVVAGLGVAATTAIVSRNMDALKSGFDTKRGLNFAGETANYFTRNAVTMRQRAVQSMQKSNMNARSAFGQEASLMHMNRDMFSQYKRPLR